MTGVQTCALPIWALFDLPLAVRRPSGLPFEAPHFVRQLDAAGRPGRVETTLDLDLQRALQTRVSSYIGRKRALGINNASAMLVDTRTMQVVASLGSADFFDKDIQGQVDGTRAKRSPGSTLKPFVYGMAIDAGLIHPASLMKDAPRRFAAYTPENFDRGFMGPVSATDALIYSRNVPAIELLSRVGHQQFHSFLEAARVHDLADADYYGLAMVLGGIELTMEDVVRLYAMLANGGTLMALKRTPDQASPAGRRLLSPEASFLVLDMLRQNPRPDSLLVATKRPPVAWKTGTSYAFRDAWSVGLVGHYALAVWVGNFDGSGNPELVGRQAAAPLFFSIADGLLADDPGLRTATEPPPELNLVKVEVCAGTGDLAGRHCPRTRKSWFIPGVSPIRVSDVHRAVRVDVSTGLRSCEQDDSQTRVEVFEFWPTDIGALFRKAGLVIRRPPPWSPGCNLNLLAGSGNPPKIRSLSDKLSYRLRPGERNELPLTAVADADVSSLFWFANDNYLGRTAADEALIWAPGTGKHRVLAVDDLGRSDSIDISVAMAMQ